MKPLKAIGTLNDPGSNAIDTPGSSPEKAPALNIPANPTTAPIKENKYRLLELDMFRGIAALYVLCFHFTSYYSELPFPNKALFLLPTGIFGVQLFFMISGFVIFMTLEKAQRPMDFIVSRFSRLYPGYWTAVLLTFLLVNVFHLIDRASSITLTLVNLSMIQEWIGFEHVDGVYWTLSIELSFYVVMLGLFMLKKLKYAEAFGLGWLLLMAWQAKTGFHASHFMAADNLLKYGNLFLAGIIFYNLKTKGPTLYRYACLALCLLVQALVKVHIQHNQILDPIVGTGVIFLLFLLFQLFISGKLSRLAIKPMVFLGTISYSLYLTHQNIGIIAMTYLHSLNVSPFLAFFVPLLFALLTASLITYGIEKPAMDYMRKVYKKWQLEGKGVLPEWMMAVWFGGKKKIMELTLPSRPSPSGVLANSPLVPNTEASPTLPDREEASAFSSTAIVMPSNHAPAESVEGPEIVEGVTAATQIETQVTDETVPVPNLTETEVL